MQTKQTNRMPSICKDILFLERLFFSALKIASIYHCKWLIINNICFSLSFDNFDMITIGILLSVLLASSFFAFLSSSFLVFLLLFPKYFFPGLKFSYRKGMIRQSDKLFFLFLSFSFLFLLLSPFSFWFFSCFVWFGFLVLCVIEFVFFARGRSGCFFYIEVRGLRRNLPILPALFRWMKMPIV